MKMLALLVLVVGMWHSRIACGVGCQWSMISLMNGWLKSAG